MKNKYSFLIISIIFIFCLFSTTAIAITMTDGFFYYADTGSIAPGKAGASEGSSISSSNFTNNDIGIYGVKLDFVFETGETMDDIFLADFQLRTGNTNDVGTWITLNPSGLTLSKVSDEAILWWSTPLVKNEWLELEYLSSQYLYFGNLVGDSNLDGNVTPFDELLVINHINSSSSDYIYDYDINGDGINSSFDAIMIQNLLDPDNPPSIADGPFVNTPVPEPSTILLLGGGLLGLGWYGRKRKKS